MKPYRQMLGGINIGAVQIPSQLRNAVAGALVGFPKDQLKRSATILSQTLRARTTDDVNVRILVLFSVVAQQQSKRPNITSEPTQFPTADEKKQQLDQQNKNAAQQHQKQQKEV
jgi:hypothetical protein